MQQYHAKRYLSVLCEIIIVGFLMGHALGQESPADPVRQRSQRLRTLLNSLEGTPEGKVRVFRPRGGYVSFILAPPSTHFPVDSAARTAPQQAADRFLREHRGLFVNDSSAVGFDMIRMKSRNDRSYLRYRQTYGGLEVFGAQMIVKVNAAGGIESVSSDIMVETADLDDGRVALNPTLNAAEAQTVAVQYLADQHSTLRFEASEAVLKVYSPAVVGLGGSTRLVWQTEVGNTGDLLVKELVLIDAHTGDVAFHYSLIKEAKNRVINDYDGSTNDNDLTLARSEGDPDTGIADVDDTYDYLGDTYDFYMSEHQRDSYDDGGALMEAWVRYGTTGARWFPSPDFFMRIAEDEVTDDTVGHEFTHGVCENEFGGMVSTSQAIEESFCDMWGEWIDQDNGDAGTDWYLFEDWASTPYPWRRMDRPDLVTTSSIYGPAFGSITQPDKLYGNGWYYGDQDDYGAHHNLGVGNKLCYLLTDGDTFNGYSITGLGISKAADLFYECMTNHLTSGMDYYAVGGELLSSADDISLTSTEKQEVEEACMAVEILPALMGRWGFNEGSGTTAGDSTQYGRSFTISGNPTWVTGSTGQSSDKALELDGNDYASRDALPALGGSAVTISTWIKASSTTDTYDPIVTQYDNSSGDDGYYLTLNVGKPTLYLDAYEAQDSSSVNTGNWYHIAGTYDGSNLKIYVNGDEEDSTSVSDEYGVSSTAYIGASGTGNYFNGTIDEVRVYNYALSDNAIKGLSLYGQYATVFSVRDSSDELVAWIDNQGNLFLTGTLTQTTPSATGDDEFRIQDSSSDKAIINMTTGDMIIAGSINEDQTDLSGANHFVIKDDSDSTVGYIDTSGNLYLEGHVYENITP